MSEGFWGEVGHLLLVLGGILVLWVQGRLLGREARQIHRMVNSQRDELLMRIEDLEKLLKEAQAKAERPGPEKK